MNEREQYPRLMTGSVVIGAYGDDRSPIYRGQLFMVRGPGDYTRLVECDHRHRQKRKALECADRLAVQDGAPR